MAGRRAAGGPCGRNAVRRVDGGTLAPHDGTLYGRGRIIEFVRRAMIRTGVPERPFPIMLLDGPRGSGGSAVLDRLWADLSRNSLGVRLDLASAQETEDIVSAVMQGLGRSIPGVRAIRFHRLKMGFKALSYSGGGDQAQFEEYLRSGGRDAKAVSLMDQWARQAAPLLGTPEQQVLVSFSAYVLGSLFTGIGSQRDRRTLNWYATNGISGGGPGYAPLWELYRWRRGRAQEAPGKVAETLVAALLADLRTDFNDSRLLHGQRHSNCLLLLDNAENRAGDRFLELVVERRQESRRADHAGDPAVIVAVRRQRPRLDAVHPVAATDEQLVFVPPHGAEGHGDHPVWWYPVGLTDLGRDDVGEMTVSSVLGKVLRDADLVHTLTGGHAESADRLAVLLAHFGASAGFDPGRLLDTAMPPAHELPEQWLPADISGTVEDFLRGRVFPGVEAAVLDAMAVLAVTPGVRVDACQAALRYQGRTAVGAQEARDRLVAGRWLEEGADGSARDLHPLAALLLRRWLAHDPELWQSTHLGYEAHYSRAEHTADRHYHRLALVEHSRSQQLTGVVGHLEAQLDRCTTADWLALLDRIVQAPNRLPATDEPRTVVTALAGPEAAGDVPRVVARLTVARWLHNDRRFDPGRRLAQVIAKEYGHLAGVAESDTGALYQESARYRRIEREWED